MAYLALQTLLAVRMHQLPQYVLVAHLHPMVPMLHVILWRQFLLLLQIPSLYIIMEDKPYFVEEDRFVTRLFD